jgi:uncharacterized protein YrzB (UPF0473 family)
MDKEKEEIIELIGEKGEKLTFRVLEKTKQNGVDYLLVEDPEDEDGECWILKDTADEDAAESCYQFVDDDTELESMSKVFAELMSDSEIDFTVETEH